jgi:hypothetical protein
MTKPTNSHKAWSDKGGHVVGSAFACADDDSLSIYNCADSPWPVMTLHCLRCTYTMELCRIADVALRCSDA